MKKEIGLISFKNIGEAFEVNENSRRVSGYLSSFGTKDSDKDVIVRGAFSKSIKERGVSSTAPNKIAFLWQHEMKEPLGKFEVLQEDEKGLYFEATISEFELGDRVLAQYKDGTLNQHSIGFKYLPDKIEYLSDEDTFVIKEVNLFEGSVVTLGANPNTPFTGMKELTEKEQIKEIETFIKKLNVSKDEIFTLRKMFEQYKHLSPSIKDTLSRETNEKPEDSQHSDNDEVKLDYEYLIKNLKN